MRHPGANSATYATASFAGNEDRIGTRERRAIDGGMTARAA